jgi:hypothetical protein
MADITITLAGQEYKIGGLTIRQARDLRVGDETIAKDAAPGWVYELCIKTIAVAIRETHPEIKEEDLWNMQTTEDEIADARNAILIHAGFRKGEKTIAQLRATLAAKKIELDELEKTLAQREAKAKETGEE